MGAIFIYSRKSKWTGRGESVENQIQMCREYIERRVPGGTQAEIEVFEDEGYSGKDSNRPEFRRMMEEIRRGACSCLVCYKLDRMGRNIMDIAGMVEELNRRKVAFISIKESFDTSTPLGKTMLYIAGIFAQMEREQIAERVRDHMLQLARSGRWLGGNTPLGFSSEKEECIRPDEKVKTAFYLKEKEDEMLVVHVIFREYLKTQSLTKVVEFFLKNDIRTKRGKEYTVTTIRDILRNPVYCTADPEAYDFFEALGCKLCFPRKDADGIHGMIAFGRTSSEKYCSKENPPGEWILAKGKHCGQIPGKDFLRIQKYLEANSKKAGAYRKVRNEIALLSGILFCVCGHAMRPKYYQAKQVAEDGIRRFSYICPYKDVTRGEKCGIPNVSGHLLERQICDVLEAYIIPDPGAAAWMREEGGKTDQKAWTADRKEELLRSVLKEKEKRIDQLLAVIGIRERSPEFLSRIDLEIVKLCREREEVGKQIRLLEAEKTFPQGEVFEAEQMIADCQSFWKLFSKQPILLKREYLRLLVEQIVWNGETAVIRLRGSVSAEQPLDYRSRWDRRQR